MIVTTIDGVEDRTIVEYRGIVSGEAVMGTNVFRDFFAGITDLVGRRSSTYESELRKAKDVAITQMIEDARNVHADAVVGVDLDYEHLGGRNCSRLMVTANETAVRLR